MTSRPSDRFTIDVDGKPKVLASLRSSEKGDLFIVLRSAGRYRDNDHHPSSPGVSAYHGHKILEQRYSVHPSSESKLFNVIKHSLILEGFSEAITTVHYTKSIKSACGFAPLFGRRMSNLASETYAPQNTKSRDHSIGSVEAHMFTLFYSIFVSHKDIKYIPANILASISFIQITIGDYNVALFYSFLSLPAYDGLIAHLMTVPDDHPLWTPEMGEFIEGLDEPQVVESFYLFCVDAAQEMIGLIRNDASVENDEQLKILLENADFYISGAKDSQSWKTYLSRLTNAGFG